MSTTLDEMSARTIDAKSKAAAAKVPSFIISADSHVDEPYDLWKDAPLSVRDRIPKRHPPENRPKGGVDPKARILDMELDGVAAEVLYPTGVLGHFALEKDVQEASFRTYNDWIADYCKTSPKRLFGVPCLCVYDIKQAVAELRRCHDMGLIGGMIWQVPDPKLPMTAEHYEPLWAAAAELGAPVNVHILTGHNYKRKDLHGMEKIRGSVNIKTYDAITSLFDIIWNGTFSRHPKLKFEIVEAEIGWIPFVLQQWDYYYARFSKPGPNKEEFKIAHKPSEIFNKHVYATFMDDFVGAQSLKFWGENNCMWSSDYPHPNMTWPNSRAFLGRQIGDLPTAKQKKLLSQNVIDLYGLKV